MWAGFMKYAKILHLLSELLKDTLVLACSQTFILAWKKICSLGVCWYRNQTYRSSLSRSPAGKTQIGLLKYSSAYNFAFTQKWRREINMLSKNVRHEKKNSPLLYTYIKKIILGSNYSMVLVVGVWSGKNQTAPGTLRHVFFCQILFALPKLPLCGKK